MLKKNTVIFAAAVFYMILAFSVSAQTTTVVTDMPALIKQLQEQVKTLQAKIEELRRSTTEVREARQDVRETLSLIRDLREGMSGDDIRELQAALAEDPEIYPEALQTGFYGRLTSMAVKRFQAKHGIEQLGVVGPKTRGKLKEVFTPGRGAGIPGGFSRGLPGDSSASGSFLPPGLAKKFQSMPEIIPIMPVPPSSGTTTPGGQVTICHIPPGNTAGKHTLTIGAPALKAHLAHGDTMGACGSGGTGTTTPPVDATAPVISGLAATSTTASTSQIVWTTNENADGKVWYGTTTPVSTIVPSVMHANLVTAHALDLSGLSASSTYYYLAVSKDAAGNTATSSEQSLTTLP